VRGAPGHQSGRAHETELLEVAVHTSASEHLRALETSTPRADLGGARLGQDEAEESERRGPDDDQDGGGGGARRQPPARLTTPGATR
jgi:hypothetical protein